MAIDKHGKGHEQQHAHREESDFRIQARRNKLTGLWAAGLLGLAGDAAEAYAKEVVLADLEEAGDQDVIRKLVSDLKEKGVDEPQITAKLTEMQAEARRQLR